MKCMKIINRLFPKFKIASFVSEPEYSDNARALFEYLETNEDKGLFKNHKFVWHIDSMDTELINRVTKNYNNVIFVKRKSLKGIIYYMLSDIIVTTHGQYCKVIPTTKKQVHIMLWHGMPLKKFGHLFSKDEENGIPTGDYYIATSELFQEKIMRIFDAKKESVLISGQPRNDVLFRTVNSIKLECIRKNNEEIILYLPTYRKSKIKDNISDGSLITDGDLAFGGSKSEWRELNEILLLNSMVLVIKPHPLEKNSYVEWIEEFSNVKLINDSWLRKHDLQLYELLAASDKLLTDYSSVYIDYLLLNRPMAFFFLDYEAYNTSRGFVFDNHLEYLPGPVLNKFKDIFEFIIEPDEFEQQRERINNLFNQIKTPDACKNIVEEITTKIS